MCPILVYHFILNPKLPCLPRRRGAGLRRRPQKASPFEAPTELRVSSGHLAKRSNDRGGSRERQARQVPSRRKFTGMAQRKNATADEVENPTAAHRSRQSTTLPFAPSRAERNATGALFDVVFVAPISDRLLYLTIRAQSIADRRYTRPIKRSSTAEKTTVLPFIGVGKKKRDKVI